MTKTARTRWHSFKLKWLKCWYAYSRGFIVYFIIIASAYAVYWTADQGKVFGWNQYTFHLIAHPYTVGWLIALIFPIIAIGFILSSLDVRFGTILDFFRRDKLWYVYESSVDGDSENGVRCRFLKFLWTRVADYYSLKEFLLYSLLAGATTLVIYLVIIEQFELPSKPPWTLAASSSWSKFAGAAFLGALSGSLVFVLRRYRMFSLRPLNFLHVSVALTAGTCSGAFFSLAYPDNQYYNLTVLLTFIVGFLAAINIEFLPKLLRKQFARITNTPLPVDIEYDLSDVVKNAEIIENLNSISIFSVRELACTDPIPLYLVMPQPIENINGLLDRALLHAYFSEVKSDLARVNVHSFTQLLFVLGMGFSNSTVTWPHVATIVDNGGDKDRMLLASAKAIVKSQRHHRVLGILLEKYRETFFKHS